MKRQERELREMVQREVSRQLNAKDAIDIGSLDEVVEKLENNVVSDFGALTVRLERLERDVTVDRIALMITILVLVGRIIYVIMH